MLPTDIDTLIREAEEAMKNAIALYSNFVVGAALLTGSGKIYHGCNIENPSLMMSFCAERTALLKAITEGGKAFKAIAIVSNDGRHCFPCGACSQMIAEIAPDMDIYLSSSGGIKKFSISELLPHPFRG